MQTLELHRTARAWLEDALAQHHNRVIGSTRVVCNPRGYAVDGVPENRDFNPDLIVEI